MSFPPHLLFVLLVQVGILPPRLKLIPELVKLVQSVSGHVVCAEFGHRFSCRPTAIALKHWPECLEQSQNALTTKLLQHSYLMY